MAAQKQSKDYRHSDEKALLRPEAGAQDVFPDKKRKPAQKYRYDSSLAPELQWDEAQTRAEAEQHINAVLNADSVETARAAAEKLRALNSHFLNWSGKAEFGEFEVPSLPLFVHERLSTAAVIKTLERQKRNRNYTLDLYGEGRKSISEGRLGAYEHLNGWQNRLILGDSLQVMNSLITYEHLGGKVQMVYIDPPYGVSFGSNFMPFVRKNSVKDGDDGDLTREPEMVQAYRDTWRLGIHSWLTYMRDRLLLARELLADSGSVFVQISDENVHLVRTIMDEIFGREHFVSLISYKTTSGAPSKNAPRRINDFIIWYAKNKDDMKFNRLYVEQELDTKIFNHLEDENGDRRPLTQEERDDPSIFKGGGSKALFNTAFALKKRDQPGTARV